jgi:hypothetical protein
MKDKYESIIKYLLYNIKNETELKYKNEKIDNKWLSVQDIYNEYNYSPYLDIQVEKETDPYEDWEDWDEDD